MQISTIRYQRKAVPSPMRFQARDSQILASIHSYDGMLARRQLKALFWPQASPQAMDRRLGLLFHSGYLNMPNFEERRTFPISEPIVWLGWRGIIQVATEQGIFVEPPKTPNENQLRVLDKSLRMNGLQWHREPRWSQISHDIAVNDFRIAIEGSAQRWPTLSLEEWVTESQFRSKMDTIKLDARGSKKGVRPDGFFVLVDHLRQIDNSPARARFLVEIDNSTHPLTRFAKDKARAGLAYIRSTEYKNRFGFNSGRWLIVCKSASRLMNLVAKTEQEIGAQASNFLFTTFDQISVKSVLTEAIWLRAGGKEKVALISNIGVAR